MTDYIDRQAVIDMFQRNAYDDWNQGVSVSWANAFSECADMIRELPSEAIKALSDVPDTNVGDMISRQAAIDALWKALFEYEDKTEKQFIETDELDVEDWVQHRVFVQNMNDIDRQTILDLPSADVQPVRHGKWIKEPNCMYRCSICDNHYPSIKGYMDYCYCPSCGARMEGEKL